MILVAFGTRPELLKIEPLLKYWKSIGFKDYGIWLTGQHKELCENLQDGHWDESLSEANYQEWILDSWEFASYIVHNGAWSNKEMWYSSNRLDHIIQSCLGQAHDFWQTNKHNITACLVQGDTTSAYACALAAFHRKIPVIHLEAGLRSFDNNNPYPEEFYRRSISMMATVNLCPTKDNALNIDKEVAPGYIFTYIVGNTILDSIKDIIPGKSNKIICTLHRRENLDSIKKWFDALEHLAEKYPEFEFILPIHKNPEIYKYKQSFKYVKCIDPLDHDQFIEILKDCAAIISDSGGVAEEGSWFKKAIFLCRKETERPEASDFYTKCPTPEKLIELFDQEYEIDKTFYRPFKCPFGDGNSSEKITKVLKELKYI